MKTEISAEPQMDKDKLIHMLYDAVVDNSLWPEMVSELIEHIDHRKSSDSKNDAYISGLSEHFQRAFQLSECIVNLQEQNSTLSGVLDGLSMGILLYDHSEKLVYANAFATQHDLDLNKPLKHLKQEVRKLTTTKTSQVDFTKQLNDIQSLVLNTSQEVYEGIAIIPAKSIKTMNLPKNIATLVLYSPKQSGEALNYIKKNYYLTDSESELIKIFYQLRSLKKAAEAKGLTYESARTYLKRIFLKLGVNDQIALFKMIDTNPLSMIRIQNEENATAKKLRRNLILSDGRNLEYFSLGPENGKVILHFDALTGVAIDILGAPLTYMPLLEELNLRLITPCRPGTFRSDFKKLNGLSEWTPDLLELCEHLSVDKITLLSQAFGSCSALALAANTPNLVDKIILCAPHFPGFEPDNWRQMDLFYIISNVIGKRTPKLLEVIIPFLMRSVMQNTRKYLDRHIAKSHCQDDINVLSSNTLQTRIPIMLGERTAMGTAGLVQENYLNTHGWDFNLQDVQCPVHLLQGALDNLSDPEATKQLAQKLPNPILTMYDHLGQYLLFSQWPMILDLCAQSETQNMVSLETATA